MTLVVARIVVDNIHIESDSRITDPSLVQSDPLCGLLKTLIIHPFVSISFAGTVHYAEEALKKIIEQPIDDLRPLFSLLLNANKESGNKTDFIVATINGRVPRLYKVSNGEIQCNLQNAWIGDHDGFEAYQVSYHRLDEGITIKERMQKAFRVVIDNSDIEGIGDFHISTALDNDINPSHPVFLHQLKAEIQITEPQEIEIAEKGAWHTIPLGTTEGGSHGLSYLVTVSPDFHGVAIHYTHGNFGVLFCPQVDFKGIVITDVNGDEFVDSIKDQYGIPLRGLVKTDSSMKLVDSRKL